MTGLLTIDGVAAGYQGGIAALHDITLSVAPGSFTALLGANGAGKSTTLKAASNLLAAERGAGRRGASGSRGWT
ncbi:MAG: ATP-binding cassette domain-containing protein [Paracoccus sp. (in: a-proteobacteria)]